MEIPDNLQISEQQSNLTIMSKLRNKFSSTNKQNELLGDRLSSFSISTLPPAIEEFDVQSKF
jgi:hypothetical protein